MKFVYLVVFLFVSLVSSNAALASTCDSACQSEQIKAYFAALDTVSRQGSSVDDIDDLLSLMHDDVEYLHVEYQANFNKSSWRAAFVRNLERGAYNNSDKNQIRVLNTIYGKNHTAIEYAHGVIQEGGTWEPKRPLLILFGFTDGKISSVKELW